MWAFARPPLPPRTCPRQIPSDLVVKSQATDIIDLILQLIRHQNGVHRSCRHRTSRGAVLSTSEVQWATTKFDGVWKKFAAPVAMRTEFLPWVFERGSGSFVGRSAQVQQPGVY